MQIFQKSNLVFCNKGKHILISFRTHKHTLNMITLNQNAQYQYPNIQQTALYQCQTGK